MEDQSCFGNNSSPILLEKERTKRKITLFVFVTSFFNGASFTFKRRQTKKCQIGKGRERFLSNKNLISEYPLVLATFTFYCLECISFDQLLITFCFIFFSSVCPDVQKIFWSFFHFPLHNFYWFSSVFRYVEGMF